MTDATLRPGELAAALQGRGLRRGQPAAIVLRGASAAIAVHGGALCATEAAPGELAAALTALERDMRPRWVWWSPEAPAQLIAAGLRVATCWDLAAVHRLLHGGWRADPARIWAALHGLGEDSLPGTGQLDLLRGAGDEGADPESPVRPDGHLRPEWAEGGWARTPIRMRAWAQRALDAADLQLRLLRELAVGGDAVGTAQSESAAQLLCAELEADGLPVDVSEANRLIASFVGRRAVDDTDAAVLRARRDAAVLAHAAPGTDVDLRNPAQVRAMLRRAGIDVPDTRSWRLEPLRGAHPVVEPLLSWRRAERVATTYGYSWLDAHVGPDARLRGRWAASDGAAGRMTAQAGLHNLPAELRPAIAAPPGCVLVRADLGQIEPRVLAVVSRDAALAAAAQDDDLYQPVAHRLRVARPVAKVAVLAAMYGQTSGAAGEALRGLESAYPVAMGYLRDAYDRGRAGRGIRTYGGRLIRMGPLPRGLDEAGERAALASRGRFARNAVIQGAAAELFKAWAATVRARVAGAAAGARIVLCLHDELLLEAPSEDGAAVALVLEQCLQEAAARWAPGSSVRFVADVSVIRRWSDAKA